MLGGVQSFDAAGAKVPVFGGLQGRHPAPATRAADVTEFLAVAHGGRQRSRLAGARRYGRQCDVRDDEELGEEIAVFFEDLENGVGGIGGERDDGVKGLADLTGLAGGLDGFGDEAADF